MSKGKCVACGRVSYTKVDGDWAHPCCLFWQKLDPDKPCVACSASDAFWRGRK